MQVIFTPLPFEAIVRVQRLGMNTTFGGHIQPLHLPNRDVKVYDPMRHCLAHSESKC